MPGPEASGPLAGPRKHNGGSLADLWLARLEQEPLGGDARWWPWAWAILRVSRVVACAWVWSRLYGGVRHVGEQDVRLTLAQNGDDRTGRRLVDVQRESVLLPASEGTAPSSTRAPRRSAGTNSCKRGPSWRSGGRSTTICRRRGVRRLTVQFKPGDTVHVVEQLDWMRAQFFAKRPGGRPAAREPAGRACAASKWADRIRCLCNEAGRALASGGAGGAARRTRSPRSRSGGRGCGRTRLRHRSRG